MKQFPDLFPEIRYSVDIDSLCMKRRKILEEKEQAIAFYKQSSNPSDELANSSLTIVMVLS
jgi:hypothetical protein